MEKRFVYKAKGYNLLRDANFKVLIAANSFDEAMNIADVLAGAGGWVKKLKDVNKEIIVEGETKNDQS